MAYTTCRSSVLHLLIAPVVGRLEHRAPQKLGGDLTAKPGAEKTPGKEDIMDLQKLSEKVQAMIDGEKKAQRGCAGVCGKAP